MLDGGGHKALVKMVATSSKIIDDTLRLVDKVIRRREEKTGENIGSLSDGQKLKDQSDIVEVKQQLEVAREQVKALMGQVTTFKNTLSSEDQTSLSLGLGAGSSVNRDTDDEGDDDGVE